MIFAMIGNILIYCTHIFNKCSRNERHTLIHVQDLLWIFLLVVDVVLSYFLFQSTNRFFQNFVRLFLRKLDGFCIFVGLRFFTLNSPDQILVGTPEKTVWRMQWVDFQSKFKMKTVLDCMHNGACQMQICENGSLLPKELCRNCI